MMQRRKFCIQSSLSVASLLTAPWTVAARPSPRLPREIPLARISFENLASQLNSTFHVYAGEKGWVPLQLIRVDGQEPSPLENPNVPAADFERFSLVFASGRAA